MASKPYSCILLSSDAAPLASAAENHARLLFDVRSATRYARADKSLRPEVLESVTETKADFLFNFLSPVIVPATVLDRIAISPINFHPAPPEWPGVGSASYALYEQHQNFGATAHVMLPKVDSGPILRTMRFPILEAERCDTLWERALHYSLILFYEVLNDISQSGELAPSGETWHRPAISRAEFERWMVISDADSPEQVRQKVRALKHPRFPGPFRIVAGKRVEVKDVE